MKNAMHPMIRSISMLQAPLLSYISWFVRCIACRCYMVFFRCCSRSISRCFASFLTAVMLLTWFCAYSFVPPYYIYFDSTVLYSIAPPITPLYTNQMILQPPFANYFNYFCIGSATPYHPPPPCVIGISTPTPICASKMYPHVYMRLCVLHICYVCMRKQVRFCVRIYAWADARKWAVFMLIKWLFYAVFTAWSLLYWITFFCLIHAIKRGYFDMFM